MQKVSQKNGSALKLTAILIVAILATGCISAKSKPTAEATPAAPATPETVEKMVVEPSELTVWTVVEGNNLWSIASIEEVYNVPEQWPLIYKANLDQIIDPDLIYPGQVLSIPRVGQSEIDAAIKHAKTRGAWAVGQVESSDKAYLKNSG